MSECKGALCEVQHRNQGCGGGTHAARLRVKAIVEASVRVNRAKDALDGALTDLVVLLEVKKP